eukprot:gene8515-9429_t
MGKGFERNELPNTRESDVVILTGSIMGKELKRKNRKTTNDDMDLITNNQMLTDNLINISQNLLHAQLPDAQGLEDTTCASYLQLSTPRGDFLQILQTGALHWVSTLSISCEKGHIKLYDSLYHGCILPHVTKQVCSIVHSTGPEVYIEVVPVQQQTGPTVAYLQLLTQLPFLLDLTLQV